jgi:hypothetical protein
MRRLFHIIFDAAMFMSVVVAALVVSADERGQRCDSVPGLRLRSPRHARPLSRVRDGGGAAWMTTLSCERPNLGLPHKDSRVLRSVRNEPANKVGNFIGCGIKCEVACVKEVNLGLGNVAAVPLGLCRLK